MVYVDLRFIRLDLGAGSNRHAVIRKRIRHFRIAGIYIFSQRLLFRPSLCNRSIAGADAYARDGICHSFICEQYFGYRAWSANCGHYQRYFHAPFWSGIFALRAAFERGNYILVGISLYARCQTSQEPIGTLRRLAGPKPTELRREVSTATGIEIGALTADLTIFD